MVAGNGNGQAPHELQLLITLDLQTDACKVIGPIHNPTLAYGMLERARAILLRLELERERAAAKEAVRRIVPATGPLPPIHPS